LLSGIAPRETPEEARASTLESTIRQLKIDKGRYTRSSR